MKGEDARPKARNTQVHRRGDDGLMDAVVRHAVGDNCHDGALQTTRRCRSQLVAQLGPARVAAVEDQRGRIILAVQAGCGAGRELEHIIGWHDEHGGIHRVGCLSWVDEEVGVGPRALLHLLVPNAHVEGRVDRA